MYDDDRDALAAEYVLGTLSADERDQAEALLAIDPGFAEIVRVWERRLGELNVMVEAVEPPPEVWDKIKTQTVEPDIATSAPRLTPEEEFSFPPIEDDAPETAHESTAQLPPEAAATEPVAEEGAQEEPHDLEEPAASAGLEPLEDLLGEELPQQPQDLDEPVLASSLLPPEAGSPAPAEKSGQVEEHDFESDLKAVVLQDLGRMPGKESRRALAPEPSAPLLPPRVERSADVIVLARRVRRWRTFTVAMSAIAALLALYVGVSQFAPGLIPMSRQGLPTVAAQVAAPSPSRLVAVLQQDPTTPAFLVSIDPASRMLTVRRVSAAPEPGRSYELWLISNKYPAPRSLGVVGASEFTARPLPSGFDADTIETASYAISLEPEGGSTTGAPTGPILFKGQMVESLPGSTG
jgi:anti-sigma-K factor RskA